MNDKKSCKAGLTDDERIEISQLVVGVLDSWKVSPADQVVLLGLPEETRPRALKRYHEGTPLPDQGTVWERITHLTGIAEALRTSYPRNNQMAGVWLGRVNRRFGNRTPLATMLEDGIHGIAAVRTHLDCSYDWYLDTQAVARGDKAR